LIWFSFVFVFVEGSGPFLCSQWILEEDAFGLRSIPEVDELGSEATYGTQRLCYRLTACLCPCCAAQYAVVDGVALPAARE
jgi:hypothetical protein